MIVPGRTSSEFLREMITGSQVQPAGVDITLGKILEYKEAGAVDLDNSKRKIPTATEMKIMESVHLKTGAYKVVFNEIVSVPNDCVGFCLPRSSLLRCGADLSCAIWDPGYVGRSEALLTVHNPYGIRIFKNAKIGQMFFIKMSEIPNETYSGRYQNENI